MQPNSLPLTFNFSDFPPIKSPAWSVVLGSLAASPFYLRTILLIQFRTNYFKVTVRDSFVSSSLKSVQAPLGLASTRLAGLGEPRPQLLQQPQQSAARGAPSAPRSLEAAAGWVPAAPTPRSAEHPARSCPCLTVAAESSLSGCSRPGSGRRPRRRLPCRYTFLWPQNDGCLSVMEQVSSSVGCKTKLYK